MLLKIEKKKKKNCSLCKKKTLALTACVGFLLWGGGVMQLKIAEKPQKNRSVCKKKKLAEPACDCFSQYSQGLLPLIYWYPYLFINRIF